MRTIDISGQETLSAPVQAAPELLWLDIGSLVIDDAYQRPLNKASWTQIRKIAADFRWSRFAPVMASPLPDGRYAVIDGQHRCHAAAICGITRVPAVLLPLDAREQASSFSWVNGQVSRITVFHVYKAAIAAGEEWALACRDAVALGSCRLMTFNRSAAQKKSGEIFAISLIRDLVGKGHGAAVSAGLKALRDYEMAPRPTLYSAALLRPWLTACAATDKLERIDLGDFLSRNDPYRIIDRAVQFAKSPDGSGRSQTAIERDAFVVLLRQERGGAVSGRVRKRA